MLLEVIMPRMGQSMDEGRVLSWLVNIGDEVNRGDLIAEIETDKAVVEIESFVTGTLVQVVVAEGELVPTGTVIAYIDDGRPDVEDDSKPESAARDEPAPDTTKVPAPSGLRSAKVHPKVAIHASPVAKRLAEEHAIDLTLVEGSGPRGRIGKKDIESHLAQQRVKPRTRINASPIAKRMANEQGVDLARVTGTGPGGRIGKDDVEAWLNNQTQTIKKKTIPSAPKRVPLSKIKMATARRMGESKKTTPHFYISADIELDQALALRDWYKIQGQDISINDLILKATAIALTQFPSLNAVLIDDEIHQYPNIDLAVAVALDEGLVVPVIHNCEKLSLVEIAQATRHIIERARAGRLGQDDLSDGTFTVSNLGMYGVRQFEAIINPPQTAILAVGAIRRIPVFDSYDRLVPRQVITATVSADHRVTDGVQVARFLQQVRVILEQGFS